MGSRNNSRWHNIENLKKLGFQQLGNSTVFFGHEIFLLSAGVSPGQQGAYWVDIREANLQRMDLEKSFFLPRIVPDKFVFEPMARLEKFLTPELMDNRPNSGNVWGVDLDICETKRLVIVLNKKGQRGQVKLKTPLLNAEEMCAKVKAILLPQN